MCAPKQDKTIQLTSTGKPNNPGVVTVRDST